MKQLVDVPMTIHNIRSLARKKKGAAKEDKGVVVTLGANLTGPKLTQFFPTKTIFSKVSEILWRDGDGEEDGELNLRMGAFPLDYEIIGGNVSFGSSLFGTKLLDFELADVKGIRLTPEEGRVCRVLVVAVIKPGTGDVERLYDALKTEILFSARKAPGGEARAKAAGQATLPLPPGKGAPKDDEEETEEEVAAAADKPLVPGQKPPQRPKRTGLPANGAAR